MTTWRTNTSKGIKCNMQNNKFMVFDMITLSQEQFSERFEMLKYINMPINLELVDHMIADMSTAQLYASLVCNQGYEGIYLKHKTHINREGKRVNDAIKIKLRPTADLLCIAVEEGEGKYEGMIGSLVLQDSKGRIVKVGSGLDDSDRACSVNRYIDAIVEIEYEQIIDTYIQPTFIAIRLDKNKREID